MLRLHYLTKHGDNLKTIGLHYGYLYNDLIWHLLKKSDLTTKPAKQLKGELQRCPLDWGIPCSMLVDADAKKSLAAK